MARKKVSIDRQPLINEIEEKVKALSFPELAELTEQEKNRQLNNIEIILNNYLIEYERVNMEINNALINQKNNFPGFNDNDPRALYGLYKSLLYDKKLGISIDKLLKEGYILIETLRKAFTGKEIIYEIGMIYGRGSNRQLINKTLSLAELLSYAHADIQWRASGMSAFKLRASSSSSDFDSEKQKVDNEVEIYVQNLNSLYPKILNVLTSKGYSNEGNIYETYQNFKHEGWRDHPPKSKNPSKLTAKAIIDKYLEIRKGTQSFVSGGDYDLTQFKLLSTAPSIASLTTIGKALFMIHEYIQQGKNEKITIEKIKQQVFSEKFDKKLRTPLNELADEIEKELSDAINLTS